jgi:hypothetical protein
MGEGPATHLTANIQFITSCFFCQATVWAVSFGLGLFLKIPVFPVPDFDFAHGIYPQESANILIFPDTSLTEHESGPEFTYRSSGFLHYCTDFTFSAALPA